MSADGSAEAASDGRCWLSSRGLTVERGGARLEWHRASWNEPALRFYEGLGAELLPEDRLHRLSGEALRGLAGPD